MQKLITVNLSYYNQPKDVIMKHLEYWHSYPEEIKDKITFFIIDDCSKIHISDLITNDDIKGLDVVVYRVCEDLKCNISGIRNLGAKECKTPWYMMIDMDTLITTSLADSLIKLAENNMEQNNVFKFNRKVINNPNHKKNNKIHPGVCFIRLVDYWNVGGNEEDLVGSYGCTDVSFYMKAKGKINVVNKSNMYLDYIEEGESEISRDTRRNTKIMHKKSSDNSWSTDYVRFSWEIVTL